MRKNSLFNRLTTVSMFILAIVLAVAVEQAQALRMTEMPAELQTKNTEPLGRTLSLKLPLSQPVFHWTFLSRKDFLSGKLVLYITRAGETISIPIFQNGEFSDGWESFPTNNPKYGEIYFGFQSSKKYLTAPR